jgi:bacillopeptidase F
LDPSKGIEYYISATDNCGNTSNTTTYSLRVSSGITPGYRQDFEVEPIGWTHAPLTQAFSSDPWRWGIPSSGPGTAHSGGRVYGIQTNQGSVGRFQAALSAPPIDLTVTTAARLSFWYRYNQRNGSIPAVVAISRDGSPFSVVKQYTESTDGWEQDSVDLTPYAGSKAKVIFVLTYDGGGDCPTWLLDDVEVLDPGRVTPVTTGIHPVVITPSFPRTDRLVSGPKAFPGDPGLSNLNPSDRFSIPADWFEADKPKPAVPTYADISIVETNAHARVHLPGG